MSRLLPLLSPLLFASPDAAAHSFGQVYTPPLPFALYAWGAGATLLLSFVVAALFLRAPAGPAAAAPRELAGVLALAQRWRLGPLLRLAALALLLLCIATGLAGTPSPYGNFNMTWFWIVFLLGLAYLSALVGDLYAAACPWRPVAAAIGRLWPGFERGRLRYPGWLGAWPALIQYAALVWIELFGHGGPRLLAFVLLGYVAISLLGIALYGIADWLRRGDVFGVLFGLFARLAPIDYQPPAPERPSRLALRAPLSGALVPAAHFSVLAFVLFLLASTAFDGLHETLIWRRLFWLDLYQALLQDHVGRNPLAAFPRMRELFALWQSLWLGLWPLLYLAAYLAAVALAGRLSGLPLRENALAFALPLLPIALVYHAAHYYTLIQTQGIKILRLVSDPFGRGWDLFGSADLLRTTIVPEADTVWHVQVVLIVAGHVAGVYLSHRVALRRFGGRRAALLSQLPMLLLMIGLTVLGLWVLAQPPADA